jgi:hypothetical protein
MGSSQSPSRDTVPLSSYNKTEANDDKLISCTLQEKVLHIETISYFLFKKYIPVPEWLAENLLGLLMTFYFYF